MVAGWKAGNSVLAGAGGPLRIIFGEGLAVQSAICGTPKPVNLKACVLLELRTVDET